MIGNFTEIGENFDMMKWCHFQKPTPDVCSRLDIWCIDFQESTLQRLGMIANPINRPCPSDRFANSKISLSIDTFLNYDLHTITTSKIHVSENDNRIRQNIDNRSSCRF